VVGHANPGLQFADAAPNGGPAQARDLRHGDNAPVSLAQGQQSRKQAPLAFIERGNNAVNGFVVSRDFVKQLGMAMWAIALVNRALQLGVRHDCSRLP
jgi:hypothetical protein